MIEPTEAEKLAAFKDLVSAHEDRWGPTEDIGGETDRERFERNPDPTQEEIDEYRSHRPYWG